MTTLTAESVYNIYYESPAKPHFEETNKNGKI